MALFDPDKVPKLIVGEDAPTEPEAPAGGGELEAIAGELIDAVKAGNAADVVSALRAAFQAMEAEPHAEAEADEEE